MADGRHVRKCWKCYNSLTNRPTWTKRGWSHPIMSPICPPWCSCHGNGHCLATAHWTLCSYGRLESKRMIQFCWNLVNNRKLGPQWRSYDQILKFLKFKMADSRHVRKYWKYHNSPRNGPIGTKLGWSHPVTYDMFAIMRLPWQRPLPSNGALDIQQLWASGGQTHEPNLIKFGIQQQILTTVTVTWSNINFFFKFKMADGRC